MNEKEAFWKQIEGYRRMTPEQRLEIALGLHELACEMSRAGIRSQHPHASAAEVEGMLKQRIELAHRL